MEGNLTRTKQRIDEENITDITIAIKFGNNRGINKQQLFITTSGVLSPWVDSGPWLCKDGNNYSFFVLSTVTVWIL